MITTVTAASFKKQIDEMLNRVRYRHESIVISEFGEPAAVLIEPALFSRISRIQDRFNNLTNRITEAFEGIAEKEGLARIKTAVSASRKKNRGK